MEIYFQSLENKAKEVYATAIEARKKGLDPKLEPEIPLTKDLAERVEGLVGPRGVSKRIRELSEKPKEEAAIEIAKEIVEGCFESFPSIEEASEQALRTSLAILTEGIVAAPLEGIVKVRVKKNYDGTKYLAVYFAGPIRSAGGSDQAIAVLTSDYIRRALGLDKYKPTNEEVERFVEEVDLYNSQAARLQYLPSSQEVRKAIRNIPVEITGESTDKVEVSGYRDLERIETNQLRGGAILVLAEGVLQKAPKILKYVGKFNLDGWEWLSELAATRVKTEESKIEIKPNYKYIKDLIAGRPVLAHPSEKGGFRLRYGRSRNSGYAAAALNPTTMLLLDNFIAIGTQLKTERPGKGSAVAPCDSIEGPVVKLLNGDVVRVESVEEAEKIKSEVKEILFLGDILINYGDFLENNHVLLPSGYVEEWWIQELKQASGSTYKEFLTKTPDQEEAIKISEELQIPLHPRYTYFFHDVAKEDLKSLVSWLCTGEICTDALIVNNSEDKRILEILGVPHKVSESRVIIQEYKPLLRVLGIEGLSPDNFNRAYERLADAIPQGRRETHGLANAMELVNSFGIKVREKAPTYIGARMGRPEKAKERKMQPAVNVLFPIGQHGGRTRDVKKAAQNEKIKADLARRACIKCGEITFKTLCPTCGAQTKLQKVCVSCGYVSDRESCRKCGAPTNFFEERELEIKEILNEAIAAVGNTHSDIKGVIGMTSAYKIPEPLEKGILRSKHNVYVFKDGTARFDATDVPLTHFRPREIGISIEILKKLGYEKDFNGASLQSEEQIVELKCQDLILAEEGASYLLRVSKFLDELLVKFYGLKPFYNAEKKEDLLGHLVVGLAPHTSAAILGRIIGFTKANVGYAHPFFHAAKRRNCDGDEDAVFLLLDALLNFSKAYLPSSRGGKMDAPLVLTTRIDPREIDDEAHNIDVIDSYPLEFYEATLRYAKPQELSSIIETVENRLGKQEQFSLKFTHDTSDIAAGPKTSAYKTLGTMFEKVEHQLSLASKIRAVDERDVARRVIESHFLPDLAGNLRTFSKQTTRCVVCNTKYRRVPLTGKCRKCGGGKLVLTVSKGSVEKYLQVTKSLIDKYNLDDYLRQRIRIIEMSISSVFESDEGKQVSLADFLAK
ncbi:MAG: DNA polymerase II large subunit [Methanobacteriota archaeon]